VELHTAEISMLLLATRQKGVEFWWYLSWYPVDVLSSTENVHLQFNTWSRHLTFYPAMNLVNALFMIVDALMRPTQWSIESGCAIATLYSVENSQRIREYHVTNRG